MNETFIFVKDKNSISTRMIKVGDRFIDEFNNEITVSKIGADFVSVIEDKNYIGNTKDFRWISRKEVSYSKILSWQRADDIKEVKKNGHALTSIFK